MVEQGRNLNWLHRKSTYKKLKTQNNSIFSRLSMTIELMELLSKELATNSRNKTPNDKSNT